MSEKKISSLKSINIFTSGGLLVKKKLDIEILNKILLPTIIIHNKKFLISKYDFTGLLLTMTNTKPIYYT